jgi:aspartate carbamoyltransferase catalytic subunit
VTRRRNFWRGWLFLRPSLRTRVGFVPATGRLGGTAIDVADRRWEPGMSAAESFGGTPRTVSGMVDVVRAPVVLGRQLIGTVSVRPVTNGGGAAGRHRTQAIIDLFAIEKLAGSIDREQRISNGLRTRLYGL